MTRPSHITQWNFASPEWCCPTAEVDLRPGGAFSWRMEARDGSMGFDFHGTYTAVEPYRRLQYRLGDDREVEITFEPDGDAVLVTETFQPENQHDPEFQRQGWQAILDNYGRYVEDLVGMPMMRWETRIQAPAEKVYQVMLAPDSYRQWTAAFNPTSRYEGSWDAGATIHFIGEGENGSIGGMVARIRENIPNRFVSIEHLGVLAGDQELYEGPEVDDWAGGRENYSFTPDGDHTVLLVELTYNAEFREYFDSAWPEALARLKAICEAG